MNDDRTAVEPAPASDGRVRHLVILDASAFIRGWLISVTLWVGALCIFVVAQELASSAQSESDWSYVPGLALMVLWYGFGIALLVAAPLGWLLGFLLRPVPNQWLHVLAFFAAPTLVFWVLGGLLGSGWTVENLGLWATVGAASALGRFAVRRNLDQVQVPPRD